MSLALIEEGLFRMKCSADFSMFAFSSVKRKLSLALGSCDVLEVCDRRLLSEYRRNA